MSVSGDIECFRFGLDAGTSRDMLASTMTSPGITMTGTYLGTETVTLPAIPEGPCPVPERTAADCARFKCTTPIPGATPLTSTWTFWVDRSRVVNVESENSGATAVLICEAIIG